MEAICDRIEKLAKEAEKLAALTPADKKKLTEKHQKELDRVARSLQSAAFEAGVKAQGEESFFRAVKRIQEVAKELKKIGK
jgi:dsDNA-specific endonuclease/ATPase MutS2